MLKISVITASYNQGQFIQKCIDSVRAQQDVFVEHIILDNCSTDKTIDLLNEYRSNTQGVDLQIIVEPDKGQTSAINRGFLIASGDVVCWLNTDEWYSDGSLAKVVDFFNIHPEVDVVFGNCDFVDVNGDLVKRKREFCYSESMLVFYGCYFPSCATFIRRRVIDEGLLLDTEFKVTMDFDWYVRIAKAGYRICNMPENLASFTWHASNISSNYVVRRLEERRMVQDRYSGVKGPGFYRTAIYSIMRNGWIFIRILKRTLKRLALF